MRHRRSLGLLVVICMFACSRRETGGLSIVGDAEFDAGELPAGSVVAHDFVVRNDTLGTIPVDRVVKTCGCTQADLDPSVLPPGGSSVVHTTLHLDGYGGKSVSVYLSSSALVGRAPVSFHVRASVSGTERFSVEPQMLDFAAADKLEQHGLLKYFYRTEPLDHVEVVSPNWLTIVVEPPRMSAIRNLYNEQSFAFSVTRQQSLRPGTYDGFVDLAAPDKRIAAARVAIRAVVLGDFVASPDRVFLGVVDRTDLSFLVKISRAPESEALPTAVTVENGIVEAVLRPDRAEWELLGTVKGALLDPGMFINTWITVGSSRGKDFDLKIPVVGKTKGEQ
jgi:hypothetical protein